MIDVRPLVFVREGCADEVEKEVLRALADDTTQDLPFPSRLYETGGAKKLLSKKAFQALEVFMRNVSTHRAQRAQSAKPRVIVCGLAAITVGECSRSALKGKRKVKNDEGCCGKKVKQGTSRERPLLQRFCKMKHAFPTRQMSPERKPSSSSSSEEHIKVKIEVKGEETSDESSSDLVVLGEWRPGYSSDSMDGEMVIDLSSDTDDNI